jgi:hypothetical protein
MLSLSNLSLVISDSLADPASDAYDSGYDYGCEDGISDSSNRYINPTLEAPSLQADSFRNGYYDGFHACSRNLDTENIDSGINRTGESDIGIDPGAVLS